MQQTATIDPISAAQGEFERMMARNIKGLNYFTSPAPVVGATPREVLIERGPMRLNHYRPMTDEVYRVPILLVMATTNRGFIFDMVPGQSLVEFLLRAGFDVFMLEWEAPRSHERSLTLESYVLDFLPAAVARVREETGEPDVSMVGYCFGGVLSLLYAALHPAQGLANLVTFTTPIDFSRMDLFSAWSDPRFFDVDRLVDTFGNVPGDMLYASFDMLRPAARTAANMRLYDNLWDDEYVKSFRMFERWNTDTLPLAGEYFRQTTKKLMWDNSLYKGTMTVGGRAIDLGGITVPFLHLAAEHDHIVPREASAPLLGMIGSPDKQEIMLKGGHVSLVAGGNAIKRMWPALANWLAERSI
ncbi:MULTISPECIES: PHA/PHB synthase family protein [Sphingomonas]|uniref:Alpha/beta fold hydrolase n=1 Tax=Sphingomonas lycopersici TaxID=2951807 RepID=A0AA41ZEY8_9SPHN|nr:MULTISPECIES: alpha/beta fold hydrolase [Sphingomonas]MCW6534478.1 alpha/beta fold hydrolase [Sphingomonas lycopersici]OJU19967.1 MAG: poly-beta-hydroxybutyrate polymerase [Sphingomonas sp. 66-10]